MITVCIGILAHNEEQNIDVTLQSLFQQDIFEFCIAEITVVANGCSDGTVEIAEKVVAGNHDKWSRRGTARVVNLAVAGKANAWNEFVHRLSSPAAEYLVLMDADISLSSNDVLRRLVQGLEGDSSAAVSVDTPKRIGSSRWSPFHRALSAASPTIDPADVPLCGQLYCARSSELRRIKIPSQISCEDGFLRALLLTHGFTRPEDRKRIMLVPGAEHVFASVSGLRELVRHERWIVSGSIVNMLLFERFGSARLNRCNAMMLMEQWATHDPEWLPKYIHATVNLKGWFLLPRSWWLRRWTRWRSLSLKRKVTSFPITLAAWTVDLVVFFAALRDVRQGRAFGYWLDAEGLKTAISGRESS